MINLTVTNVKLFHRAVSIVSHVAVVDTPVGEWAAARPAPRAN